MKPKKKMKRPSRKALMEKHLKKIRELVALPPNAANILVYYADAKNKGAIFCELDPAHTLHLMSMLMGE